MALNIQEVIKSIDDDTLADEQGDSLKHMLKHSHLSKLLKIYDTLSKIEKPSKEIDCIGICIEIMKELDVDEKCLKLLQILKNPYFRCLIEAHDNIVYETYKFHAAMVPVHYEANGTPIRVIGLTKNKKDPLGITLGKHSDDCIYIKRILKGTMLEKQGLLNVGDIVKCINTEPVGTDLNKAQQLLSSCEGSFTMKVLPGVDQASQPTCQVFLRCHFDYKPKDDELFPKHDSGLTLKKDDIIEVIDQSDTDWWQARHLDTPNTVGMIPSLTYEQMRRSNITSKHKEDIVGLFGKGKKKIMYSASKNSMFDCLDMQLYEEVTKMPPIQRKLIALMGAQGVGRRSIKNHFIKTYPDLYATNIPDTSRPPRDGETSGRAYNFIERELMHHDITMGAYLEWGEHNGHFYGTKLDAVRDIINSGKTCIIDCDASSLKLLKTAEFMPYIVFIESPSLDILITHNHNANGSTKKRKLEELKTTVSESNSLKDMYHRYFDVTIKNINLEETCTTLKDSINEVSANSQWVPISWVY